MTPSLRIGSLATFSLVLLLAASCSDEGRARADEPTPPPSANSPNSAPSDPSADLEGQLDLLREIGYVDFSPNAPSDPDSVGVVLHDKSRVSPGYNLYASRIEHEAYLMDLHGEIVHRWSYPGPKKRVWDHVVMMENGDLLVIVKFVGVMKRDWNSNLIWRRPLKAHHDIAPAADGSLYVLSMHFENYRNLKVQFPTLVQLSEKGKVVDGWRSIDHLDELQHWLDSRFFLDTLLAELEQNGELESYLQTHPNGFDYFHANTVTILPKTPLGERDARFRAGNLMLCLRNVDQIVILDAQSKKVVWSWGANHLEHPHHPTMLDDGNILIFDNGVRRRHSRVVEIEPASGEPVWQYVADPAKDFFTEPKGSSQRLPNGNTLICQGDYGQVFEVTPEGERVWEWKNPAVIEGSPNPRSPGIYRVALYRMMRLDPAVVEPLLQSSTNSAATH